jgi:hypothetical protein
MALAAVLWSTSLGVVLAVMTAGRRFDDVTDRDLAEAIRVRDLGLPSLPPLTSRSGERAPAVAHSTPDSA